MMTTSVTSIERIASATGVPCATRTSTWRSLEMISSGVCLFLRIVILLRPQSHTSGWTTSKGEDHGRLQPPLGPQGPPPQFRESCCCPQLLTTYDKPLRSGNGAISVPPDT